MSDFHQDIDLVLSQIPYGEATFHVKKHNDAVVSMDANTGNSFKFKGDENTTPGAVFIQMVKNAATAGFTGAISFTLVMKEGNITRIVKSDNAELSYRLPKPENPA